MKRLTTLIMIVLLAAMTIYAGGTGETSGASSTADSGHEITIMGGAHLVSVAEIVLQDYMEAHPDVTIKFEKYSYAEYPTKMRIALSQRDSNPDVMIIHDEFINQLAEAGLLMDLSDLVDQANTLDVMGPATVGDAIYGIPNQVTNQYVFLYRKDVYDALGLQPPKTFDEFFEQALTLKENGYYAGAWDPSNENCDNMFYDFLYMLGGEVLDQDGNVSLDKAEEAIALLQKCVDAGIFHTSIQSDSTEYWTAFNAGEIAAFPGPGSHAAYYETNVDPEGNGGYGYIAAAPAMRFCEDGPATYIHNTEYWAINKYTDEPELAREIVEYLTQTIEACMLFCNANEPGVMARYSTGYVPGIQSVASGEGVEVSPAYGDQSVVSFLAQNMLDNKDDIVLPFVDKRSAEIGSAVSTVLGDMFLNGRYSTPAEAAEAMRTRIENI